MRAAAWSALPGSSARFVAVGTHRFVLVVTLPLLACVASLWLRSEGSRAADGARSRGCGLGLLSVIEVVFLADDLIGSDFERMNTVFKFDYQAWSLLMFAAIGIVSRYHGAVAATPPAAQVGVSTLLVLGIALSLFYPLFGSPSRLRQRMQSAARKRRGWTASRGWHRIGARRSVQQ